MQARQLFDDDRDEPRQPKLRRQNAMRRKRNPLSQAISAESIVRNKDDSIFRNAISNPTSPSKVKLDRVNNLNLLLRPNSPFVPQAVHLGHRVQRLNQALENGNMKEIRCSARIQAHNEEQGGRIDYRKMHKYGKTVRGEEICFPPFPVG